MKKAMFKTVSVLLICVFACSLVMGCKTKVPDTEDTLEIYIQELGYGRQWLNDEIELFKQQDWVKEKYPNLNIPEPQHNATYGYGGTLLRSGTTTVDLIFTLDMDVTFHTALDERNRPYVADLNDLFESTVPGETVKYKDKMYKEYADVCGYNDDTGKKIYRSVPWQAGYSNMMYNHDILVNKLGLTVPRTTDEFIAVCKAVSDLDGSNSAYKNKYSLAVTVERAGAAYWGAMMVPMWWAQYEGMEGYYDFYRGIHNGARSKDVMTQRGRLESLEVVQTLLSQYADKKMSTLEFTSVQTNFLSGNILFMPNGDWLYEEMRTVVNDLKAQGINYDIRFLKNPVISSIVDRTPSVKTVAAAQNKTSDAVLCEIIDAIDNGETEFAGIMPQDFTRIKEARTMILMGDQGSQAFIPAGSTAEGLAKDFLLFLSTDIALEQYMKSTGGASLPFYYSTDTQSELYKGFDNIQKTRIEIFSDNPFFSKSTRSEEFKVHYLGGLKPFPVDTTIDEAFLDGSRTAKSYYDDCVAYYNDARWRNVLRNAGYN